jgi:predicted PurR-regulated permease PerM
MIMPVFKKIDSFLNNKTVSAFIVTIGSILIFSSLFYFFYRLIAFFITELNHFFITLPIDFFLNFNPELSISPIDYLALIFSDPSKQLFELVLMIFLIYYTLTEYDDLSKKAKKFFKNENLKKINDFKKNTDALLKSVFLKYFLKGILLMTIILVMLSSLNITYAFEISILSLVFLLVPFLNAGLLLLLVAVYNLINGNIFNFIILLIDTLLIIIIHYNYDQIFSIKKDVNPLLFIACLMVGFFSLGIFGFIAGAVLSALLQAFYETISSQ